MNEIADSDLEKRIVELGSGLLEQVHKGPFFSLNRWLQHFMDRVMKDEIFRVQVLRFIDVLPALEDDTVLFRHLQEYFDIEEISLPYLVKSRLRQKGLQSIWVAKAVRRMMKFLSRRFIGGENYHQALETAGSLRKRNIFFPNPTD